MELEAVVNAVVVLEVIAAAFLAGLNVREVRFLERLRPVFTSQRLPLYDALTFRARYITFVCVWLLGMIGLAALGVDVAEVFPPIRAINGALILGLLSGPHTVGSALRKAAPAVD